MSMLESELKKYTITQRYKLAVLQVHYFGDVHILFG